MNTIKIGSMDFDAIKVGDGDVDKIYAGDTLIYESTPPTPPHWVTYQDGNGIPLNVQFYGIRANVNVGYPDSGYWLVIFNNIDGASKQYTFSVGDNGVWGFYADGTYNTLTPDADGYVTAIFSDYTAANLRYSGIKTGGFTLDILQY